MIIAIVRQALSPAVLNPVLRDGGDALSRHLRLRRRPCRKIEPVVFVDDDEIPEPTMLRTRKTFCSNSWPH
jgi:hypothetical protein